MKSLFVFALTLCSYLGICQTLSGREKTEYKLDSLTSFKSSKGYIPSLLFNIKQQGLAPLHLNGKSLLITSAAIGITGYLVAKDGEMDEWARNLKSRHSAINFISPKISVLGSNAGIYAMGAFGLISSVFNNNKGTQTSLLATQAMITSGIWVHLIKAITLRERPDQSYKFSQLEGGKWYGPALLFDKDKSPHKSLNSLNAFASGHTATAFAIATVIAKQYNDQKWIPVVSYGTASLVGLSRLTEHKHWASDVFAGAILGYVCGNQVISHFNKTHSTSSQNLSLRKGKSQVSFFGTSKELGIKLLLQ